MWYRQALAIGRAEGTIQCTYAIIYDKSGEKLFALQRKNFEDKLRADGLSKERSEGDQRNIVVDTYYGAEGIIAWQLDAKTGGDFVDTGYIAFDMPLVIADEHSDDRLVPVRLDYNAIAYIKKTLASAKEINAYVFYKVGADGKRVEDEKLFRLTSEQRTKFKDQAAQKDADGLPLAETIKDYHPRWLKLSQSLNDTDTFYVKPAAFDWQPVDTRHMNNGSNPDWVLRRDEAKSRLDKARKLLIAAGFSNIL